MESRKQASTSVTKKADYSHLRELSNQAPLLVTLDQEIQRYDNLLNVVHSSLGMLRQAIQGQIIMSEKLENAFNSMLNNKVPSLWRVSNATT